MDKKSRIGIIGIGSFCSNYHIPNFLRRPDVEVTAVCDVSRERLDARSEGLRDAREFTDYRDLVDPDRVDGVHVSTPNSFHFEQAKLALERGIPVMVDKPLTMTVAQAKELVHLSKSNNCILMTAFTRHFMASSVHVRQKIASDETGPVQMVSAIQRRHGGNQPNPNGGMLLGRSVHITDVIPWLTGKRVTAAEGRIEYGDHGHETFVDIRLELEGGVPARLLGIKDTSTYQDEVTVYGEDQSYRLERDRLYAEGPRNTWTPMDDLPDCGNSTAHFCDLLQRKESALENSPTDLNGQDGLRSLRVIEAIVEAGRTGRSVEIKN